MPSKVPYFTVKAGETLVSTGPSGGGYGNPKLRKRAAIDQDIADGLISLKTAKKLFPNQF